MEQMVTNGVAPGRRARGGRGERERRDQRLQRARRWRLTGTGTTLRRSTRSTASTPASSPWTAPSSCAVFGPLFDGRTFLRPEAFGVARAVRRSVPRPEAGNDRGAAAISAGAAPRSSALLAQLTDLSRRVSTRSQSLACSNSSHSVGSPMSCVRTTASTSRIRRDCARSSMPNSATVLSTSSSTTPPICSSRHAASSTCFFPRLRPGGLFIVEDWNSHHLYAAGLRVGLQGRTRSGRDRGTMEEGSRDLAGSAAFLVHRRTDRRREALTAGIKEVCVGPYWITIRRDDSELHRDSFAALRRLHRGSSRLAPSLSAPAWVRT